MNHDTANSACKHTKSIKFGGRRRQCISCKKTWSVRARKRGAKPRKNRVKSLEKTFVEKLTLVQQARRAHKSANAFSKQHAQTLTGLCEKPWPHTVPEGSLVLVMDGIWFTLNESRTRSTSQDFVRFRVTLCISCHPFCDPVTSLRSSGEKS